MPTVVDDTVNAPKDTVLSLLITRTDLTTAPTYQQVNMEAEKKKKSTGQWRRAQIVPRLCSTVSWSPVVCAAQSAGAPWPVQHGQLKPRDLCSMVSWCLHIDV